MNSAISFITHITALLALGRGVSSAASDRSTDDSRRITDWRPPTSYHADVGVLRHVNPLIGTFSYSPNGNGGMIPSVPPPFGMTRWTPQTRENFISQCPYHYTDGYVHGFQTTHQPAIWMGESGHGVLSPGEVKPLFQERGLEFRKKDERSTPYVHEVVLDADTKGSHGWNLTEESAKEGPVPGGGQEVPDDVKAGANGRERRDLAGDRRIHRFRELSEYSSEDDNEEQFSHSIKISSHG